MENIKKIFAKIGKENYELFYKMNTVKQQKVFFLLDMYNAIFINKKDTKDISYEAWRYGPVNTFLYATSSHKIKCISYEKNDSLSKLFEILSKATTNSLVDITHSLDSWKKAYSKKQGLYDNHIILREELIKESAEKIFK